MCSESFSVAKGPLSFSAPLQYLLLLLRLPTLLSNVYSVPFFMQLFFSLFGFREFVLSALFLSESRYRGAGNFLVYDEERGKDAA